MSHHHHRHRDSNDLKTPQESGAASKLFPPIFSKNDLALLSLIKPILSPNGQKLVDLIFGLSNIDPKSFQLDIPGLIAQLNVNGENNPLIELLPSLLNMAAENQEGLNPLLNTLISVLNKNKQENNPPEDN